MWYYKSAVYVGQSKTQPTASGDVDFIAVGCGHQPYFMSILPNSLLKYFISLSLFFTISLFVNFINSVTVKFETYSSSNLLFAADCMYILKTAI